MPNKDDILDFELANSKTKNTSKILKWWEDKRLLYNGILILTEILIMVFYWKGTVRFGLYLALFWSILYTIVANFLYSLGWMIEILVNYYVSKIKFSKKTKNLLWISGVLFSIILTWKWYEATLKYYLI